MINNLIIGCGDIGRRVGQKLLKQHAVTGVVRSAETAAQLNQLGFVSCIANLDDSPVKLPAITADTVIYYFAPPPDEGEHDPRMANFLQTLTAIAAYPAKIIYISTTAVYGESAGNWVDEQSPTRPNNARGKRRLDAESQLIAFQQRHPVTITILRVAGIYGATRLPFQQIKTGKPILKLEIAPFSNRIHASDLADICIAAAQQNSPPLAIFNVSDGNPGSISQYFQQVALAFKLPAPPEITWEAAQQQLSPGMLSYLKESKRIDNRRVISELGISLRYPTLEEGLRQCAEELNCDHT